MADLEITFLGTSASIPTVTRGVSATLIRYGGLRFLVDCGEGTQRQMMKYGGLKAPDAIFLTHYHPDHTLGLPGLLATIASGEDPKPIDIFGPKDGLNTVREFCRLAGGSGLGFVNWWSTDEENPPTPWDDIHVYPFSTKHTNHSQGYSFVEVDLPGRFDVDLARELGVKSGPDYGRLMNGESVEVSPFLTVDPERVIGPKRPGRRVAITGDCRPIDPDQLRGPNFDILIHDATFVDSTEGLARARTTKHSTIGEAVNVGKLAGVGKTILTHFSPRDFLPYDDYPDVMFAKDGDTISLPVPS